LLLELTGDLCVRPATAALAIITERHRDAVSAPGDEAGL
jgi:hypothetical protein